MNCSRFETLLTDYLEQQLDPPVRQATELHLEDCPGCQDLLENVRALRRALWAFPELTPPRDLIEGILARTTGRPGPGSVWSHTVVPAIRPFFTRRFSLATVGLFATLSLMVNLAGPPVRAVLSPGGLVEGADRLTAQVAMKWARVLSLADSVVSEIRLLEEDLYGRLDYHLISLLFKSYQQSLDEQQLNPADSGERAASPLESRSNKGEQ